jgi:hypothetical protein
MLTKIILQSMDTVDKDKYIKYLERHIDILEDEINRLKNVNNQINHYHINPGYIPLPGPYYNHNTTFCQQIKTKEDFNTEGQY